MSSLTSSVVPAVRSMIYLGMDVHNESIKLSAKLNRHASLAAAGKESQGQHLPSTPSCSASGSLEGVGRASLYTDAQRTGCDTGKFWLHEHFTE